MTVFAETKSVTKSRMHCSFKLKVEDGPNLSEHYKVNFDDIPITKYCNVSSNISSLEAWMKFDA